MQSHRHIPIYDATHRHIAHVKLSFRNIAREGIIQLEVLRRDNVLEANTATHKAAKFKGRIYHTREVNAPPQNGTLVIVTYIPYKG